MNTDTIGLISALIVNASAVPYIIRIWQGKINPNIASWSTWAIISFALLITYKGSGAKSNLWPMVAGVLNPTIVTILALLKGNRKPIERWEIVCAALGCAAIVLWYFVQDSAKLVQWALYLAIVADAFAAIPTLVFLSKRPMEDRPGAWFLFALGFGVGMFAITDHTVANYALPVWMTSSSSTLTLMLVIPRLKRGVPIREWI